MEGLIVSQKVLALIDICSNLNYIRPKIDQNCTLKKKSHGKYYLVELAVTSKKRVTKLVE